MTDGTLEISVIKQALKDKDTEIERLRVAAIEATAQLIHERSVHIRNNALEEAAKVAETTEWRDYGDWLTLEQRIAAAIRTLKGGE